ncbi:hypothetical protein AGMMS49936_10440 [Endomicrobiia bacterium]|nr:hypothetical protein AGMMS49936_10440 [Endomicrobiia bacterium]
MQLNPYIVAMMTPKVFVNTFKIMCYNGYVGKNKYKVVAD